MLAINDKHIILGSIGGGGGGACDYPEPSDVVDGVVYGGGTGTFVCPSDIYPGTWLTLPAGDDVAGTVGGESQVVWLLASVDDAANNYAVTCAGAYTVAVYDKDPALGGVLISTANIATGIKCDFSVAYSACHIDSQQPDGGRQALVKITPQTSNNLTSVVLSQPTGMTSLNSRGAFLFERVAGVNLLTHTHSNVQQLAYSEWYGRCNLTTGVSAFSSTSHLVSVNRVMNSAIALTGMFVPSGVRRVVLSALAATTASNCFVACYSIQSIDLTVDNRLVTTTSMLGGDVASTSLYSLKRCKLNGLTVGFVVRYTQMDATALDELFTSLGTASGAQTIDVRNNPGSATCDTSIATAKGYTVLTA